jgi:hypothetical protein
MTDDTRPEVGTDPEIAPDDAAPEAAPPEGAAADPNRFGDRAGQEPGDLTLSLTPRQILGGFALVAAAVVLLRRRGRTGRDSKG